ncbi:MAG: adenylate/guanylate cyclase domain-containing protein [Panacagrimonas sp.]
MSSCSNCGAVNAQDARFCNQCGARLNAALPQSSTTHNAYTPQHLVERVLRHRSAMLGERKRVTVLFADIKGSTRLAQQAGAEAWHGILDRFFGLLAQAVHRYEGTINQYTGDGVMALFGAPVAHEDHAQRACLAALDMQAAVRSFADELRLEHGLNLSLRVGLNSGEVIVGRIGDDLRMDYTAQGVTVNLAARLEQICEPGQVYLSRSTAAWVGDDFVLRDLGATRINGLDQAVDVFALEGRDARGSRLQQRLARGASVYLGREAELARLQACLALAAQGQGRVVAVTGAAGMGKSRLCHEFLAAAERRGLRVHRTAASPYARHQPMASPRALFLSRIGCAPGDAREKIRERIQAQLPPSVRERPGAMAFALEFAGVGLPGELNEQTAVSLREPMLRGLAQFLPQSEAAQIILFEDLHHLDPVTLEFTRQLAAAVAGTPSLLLLTWRADALSEALPPADERLDLSPLSLSLVTRLAATCLGEDASLLGLAERIGERAAGNPFFVEEAVMALAETGHLHGTLSAYRRVRKIVELPIADTVHALIAARIDRLPAASKAWLHAAAVIGADFDPVLLGEVAADGEDPAPALVALERAGFLRSEDGGARRSFAQPLLREVAYGTQLESSRTLMHARLAQALQRACGDNPVQSTARGIAEHWTLAGEWAQAGRWNLHAAMWFATRDARITAEQFDRAIEHLDRAAQTEDTRRLRIAARAGLIRMAQLFVIDQATVDRCYVEARQLADDCGDPVCAAELAISYGNAQLQRGDTERAVELVEAGLRLCPESARASLANRFRLAILISFSSIGRAREGLELANWAGGDAWLSGPISEDNCLSRAFVSSQRAWVGELARAQQELSEAILITERDGRGASWMHGLRVELAWFSGDTQGVLEESEQALEQAETFGSPYFRALALRAQGQALILLGRHAEAIAPLREARPLAARGAGAYQFEAHHLAVLAEACLGAGQVSEAAQLSQEAVLSAQASGGKLWELRAWIARLALPPSALNAEHAAAGFARARELIQTMQARGVEPHVDELAAARSDHPLDRSRWLERAIAGYEWIGAPAHAKRVRIQRSV